MAQTKSELLAEAKELGVEADNSMSIQEIQKKVDKAKADDAGDAAIEQKKAQQARLQQAQATQASQAQRLSDEPAHVTEAQAAQPHGTFTGPTGNVYGLGEAETVPEPDEVKAIEGLKLTDMPHSLLERLSAAVNNALGARGVEPARPVGPALNEIVGTYPENTEARDHMSVQGVAKKAKLDDGQVLAFTVRQARAADGKFYGPAYLRVVDHQGKKQTLEL